VQAEFLVTAGNEIVQRGPCHSFWKWLLDDMPAKIVELERRSDAADQSALPQSACASH
jgi:hypothetical protein